MCIREVLTLKKRRSNCLWEIGKVNQKDGKKAKEVLQHNKGSVVTIPKQCGNSEKGSVVTKPSS